MLRGQRSDPGKWSLRTRYEEEGRSSGALSKCAAASDEDQVTVELLMINGRRPDVSCSQRGVLPPCDWLVGGASAARMNTVRPACLPGLGWAGAAGDCIPSRLPGALSLRLDLEFTFTWRRRGRRRQVWKHRERRRNAAAPL